MGKPFGIEITAPQRFLLWSRERSGNNSCYVRRFSVKTLERLRFPCFLLFSCERSA